MTVFSAKSLEKQHRFFEWRHALHRSVRHVHCGLPFAADGVNVAAFTHEIGDEHCVTACCGMMNRVVAIEVALVDVNMQFLDKELDRRQPSVWRMTM